MDPIYIIAITLTSALLAAFAQYVYKRSIRKFELNLRGILGMLTNKMIIAGLLIYVLSLCFNLFALHYGELSFVYPFIASTFIFVILISKYKLGERVGIMRVLGVLLIVLGIIFTALTY